MRGRMWRIKLAERNLWSLRANFQTPGAPFRESESSGIFGNF